MVKIIERQVYLVGAFLMEHKIHVLLVEDDQELASILKEVLEVRGCVSKHVNSLSKALLALSDSTKPYDIVLLDLVLGKGNGQEVLVSEVRGTMPIVVMSGLATPQKRAELLRLGADDVLTKPFYTEELWERLRAVLRRTTPPSKKSHTTLDRETLIPDKTTLTRELKGVITKKEAQILDVLIQNWGQFVSREVIMEEVWGASVPFSRVVEVYIGRLRSHVELMGYHITMRRGRGYQILGNATTETAPLTQAAGARKK
jgi:DNA-binding response OmpR family regulator